jgi:hypothetical protein
MKKASGHFLRESRALLAGVAGWFLIYLALAGAAGFLVTRQFPLSPGCMPFLGTFGIIESSCRYAAVDHVWFGLLGIPRFVILVPAVGVAVARAAIRERESWWSFGAYVLASIPLGVVLGVGVRHWIRLGARLAWVAVAMILVEILVLGFTA